MINKIIICLAHCRLLGALLLGTLALSACVVEPVGGVAVVGPPVVVGPPTVYVAPQPVYVAPQPVYVEPIVPLVVIGGGRFRR